MRSEVKISYNQKTIIRILRLFLAIYKEMKYYFIDKATRLTKIKKYSSLKTIKLNLGCGSLLKKGYINIDLTKYGDLRLDLRKPLPFKDNSVDYIFSEHFFEYLNYLDSTAVNCLRDYLRVLKEGAKMRMIVPDMEKFFKAYVNKDKEFLESVTDIEKQIPQSKKYATLIDYVNYVCYLFGYHKYCYDFEKLNLLLKSVGFKNIIRDHYNPSEDSDYKKSVSLYIEAEK